MRAGRGRIGIAALAMLTLAACSGSDEPQLMQLRSTSEGPDEFAILPTKPLQIPTDFAALPEPTPGGINITDPTPEADAIVALGGKPEALQRASGDGAMVTQVSRYGVAPDIRTQLAVEDLEFRRDNNGLFLERLFNLTVYFKAYEDYQLDQYAELDRLRKRGVRTSSAPPPKEN